jgi:hypothetical protein
LREHRTPNIERRKKKMKKTDAANNPPLTHHGKQRGKQRCGLDAKALARTAAKALRDGLGPDDTKGQLKLWLQTMADRREGYIQRIHGNHVYCFGKDRVLVTVLELPHDFRKAAASALRKKGGGA